MNELPSEFELIACYFALLSAGFSGAYGLRDDAAVISPATGFELVAKTDAIIGGVDFRPDEPADLVAHPVYGAIDGDPGNCRAVAIDPVYP